jgi:hypothetical protein
MLRMHFMRFVIFWTTTMLEQKDQTIIQLQDKLKDTERNIS